VAITAKLSHVGYGPELVPAVENVAEGAVPGGNRPMDELIFTHPVMALVGYARRFILLSGAVGCGKGGSPGLVNKE